MKRNKHTIPSVPKIHPTVQLIAAAAIFVVSVLLSRDTDISDWEIQLFQFIYSLPAVLLPVFFVITQTGSIYILGLLLGIYFFKRRYHIVIRLLLSGTLAYMMSGIAKDLWGRVRPTDHLLDIVNLDYTVRGPGFPSGHTALATAIALTIGHYLPKKYHWLIAVWIIGVGLSRIYLGIHFPLDILGGFAIGWFSYALFRHVRLYDVSLHNKKRIAKLKKPSKA